MPEAPTPLDDVSNGGTFLIKGGIFIELKEPKTYAQQIEILKSKSISITNYSTAKQFLKRVNYYRFSGFFLPFQVNGKGPLFPDISFERLQAIYEFDTQLRKIIINAIDEIEIYLRSQLAYYHAHKYGAEGYVNHKNYNKRHNHKAFSKKLKRCIKENSCSSVIQHHLSKYNGHFPIWVIIEYFSLGTLSYFYRGMKNNDKTSFANKLYGINYQTLDSWFSCLNDLRNRCAHHSRLYYWIFPSIPKMPRNESYIPTRRLFAQLYMLKLMYPDHEKWNNEVLKSLIKLMKAYKPYISNKHLDFPYRWKSMLTYK